jgi:hypothetical protein
VATQLPKVAKNAYPARPAIARQASNGDTTVTFTPSADLAEGAEHTVTVSGKQSAGGDTQQVGATFKFTTAAGEVVLTPLGLREQVLAELEAMLAGADKKSAKKIEQAIKHLEKGLDEKHWDADGNPSAKHGNKVFDADKQVINALTSKELDGDPSAGELVEELLDSARAVAQAAIDEAVSAGGKPKDIAKAGDELAKGDAERAKGKPEQAIDRYKSAWENALKAIR